MGRAREDRAAVVELALGGVGDGGIRSLLAIDAAPFVAHLPEGTVRELPAPEGEALLATVEEPCDAALVGGLGGSTPLALARALIERVRPGGAIAFALPTARDGFKGRAGSLLGLLRRKPPVLLEELCEALLVAGLDDIRARELDGSPWTSVVWGRVRREPPLTQ